MKGYKLNADSAHVQKIIEGLHKKNGHCPCRLQEIPENQCPCDQFVNEGICKCKLFIKIEE